MPSCLPSKSTIYNTNNQNFHDALAMTGSHAKASAEAVSATQSYVTAGRQVYRKSPPIIVQPTYQDLSKFKLI
eukprot:1394546-Amorphochlora_amoeboformis.AAC.1